MSSVCFFSVWFFHTANAAKCYQEKVTWNQKCIFNSILKGSLDLNQEAFCEEIYKESFLIKQVLTLKRRSHQ